jgi:hypothetical protein
MIHIRHLAVLLAGLAAAVLTIGAACPAASAIVLPPPGDPGLPAQPSPQIRTIIRRAPRPGSRGPFLAGTAG